VLALLGPLVAQDELERPGLANPVEVAPQLVDRVPVGAVEALQSQPALFLVAGRLDVYPRQQLARLDLRLIPVLEHRDALHRGVREALPHHLLKLMLDAFQICAFHARLREFPQKPA